MEQEVIEQGGHIGGITFGTFLLDALFIFFFVVWFWILIRVLMDLFRRKDISGVAKILWVILLVVLPYIGVFAYLLTQGWTMGERDVEQAEVAREHLRSVVGFSVADELIKLDKLKADGSISDAEYQKLRARSWSDAGLGRPACGRPSPARARYYIAWPSPKGAHPCPTRATRAS